MTNILFIANGAFHPSKRLASTLSSYDKIIAVDGGLNYCHECGINPSDIIGDLDSVIPEILKQYSKVPKQIFPKDKDKTDLEIAIEQHSPSAKKMTVWGALGKRTDHTLGNLILLSRTPGKLYFESDEELLFVLRGTVSLPCTQGQTISLIPLGGPVHGVTTRGLKWELSNATLDKHFISISNIAQEPLITLTSTSGDLLCCLQT